MSRKFAALMLMGAIAGLTTLAATPGVPGTPLTAEQTPPAQPASHAVRGRVKSVDATSLVIVRAGGRRSDLCFVLNTATVREGTIAVGGTVSVRYRTEGGALFATAVTSRPTTRQ